MSSHRHSASTGIRALTVVVVGTLMCAAAPSPETTTSARTALSEGRDAFLAKDFESAVVWLQRAYQLKPSDPDIPFNIGRCFEELGRFQQAVKSFQQVADHRRAKKADRASARSKLAALQPLLSSAHIRLTQSLRGALVMVDGKQIVSGVVDVQIEPGEHHVCAVDRTSEVLQCWLRELPAGQRIAWPPPDAAGLRATVLWQPSEPVARLEMGGGTLPVNTSRLQRLVLDPGTHELTVVWSEGDPTTLTLELAPSQQLEGQPTRPLPEPEPPALGGGTSVGDGLTLSASPETDGGGAGAGPWVTLGIGGAVLVAGVSLLAVGEADRNSVESDRDAGSLSQPAGESRWNDANTMTWIGTGLAAAGGAAAVGGVLWMILGGGDDEPSADGEGSASIEFVPLWTGGALVRGSF